MVDNTSSNQYSPSKPSNYRFVSEGSDNVIRVYTLSWEGARYQLLGIINPARDTYTSSRDIQKHLFKGGRGISVNEARERGSTAWGIDCELLSELVEQGVKNICIAVNSGTYRATVEDILVNGRIRQFMNYPPQHFLAEKLWNYERR